MAELSVECHETKIHIPAKLNCRAIEPGTKVYYLKHKGSGKYFLSAFTRKKNAEIAQNNLYASRIDRTVLMYNFVSHIENCKVFSFLNEQDED